VLRKNGAARISPAARAVLAHHDMLARAGAGKTVRINGISLGASRWRAWAAAPRCVALLLPLQPTRLRRISNAAARWAWRGMFAS